MLVQALAPFGSPSRRHEHLREYVRLAADVLGAETLARPLLGRASPPRVRGFSEWLGVRTAAGRQRRVEYAKQIVGEVAARFAMPLPKLAVKFSKLEGHAGHVQFRNGVWYVDVDEAYRWDNPGLTSILAHEFAHVVLARKGVRLEPAQRNEELTDTVAALAGFGQVLHAVCERTEEQYMIVYTRRITRRLGYLGRRDFAALISLQKRIASGLPKRRLSEVDLNSLGQVDCLSCGTTTRLPQVEGRIRIRCRVCGLKEDLKLGKKGLDHRAKSGPRKWIATALAAIDRFNGFRIPEKR